MSKSTPISQLRKEQDNSELVQNILNNMENQPAMDPNMDQMPSQQMPNQQMPSHQPRGQPEQYDDYEEEFEDYYDGPVVKQKPMSTTDQIISEIKGPLLVALLVFLTNFDMVNQLLVKNIPKLAGHGGELNLIGLGLKAIVAGIIFYVVKRFLL